MDKLKKSPKRTLRSFTSAFKAETVRLARVGDHKIRLVVSDSNLTETALRDWVRRAEIDAGNGLTGALTSDEHDEFARLRRDNKSVLMDLGIFKKAEAFFARGNH